MNNKKSDKWKKKSSPKEEMKQRLRADSIISDDLTDLETPTQFRGYDNIALNVKSRLGDSENGSTLDVTSLNLSEYEKRPAGNGNGPVKRQIKGLVRKLKVDDPGTKALKYLKKRLPILTWLREYKLTMLASDVIAGITVGLTVIPQGIAYATVAGLDAQYGLYSAFMGCFVYCVFGSSKDVTIGPTAIMALMTAVHAQYGPDYAVLLAFLSGLIILGCGLLQLGFLIDFISQPVIAGFTSAAAITIASGQVKGLLGIRIEHKSHLHVGIFDGWIDVFTYIETTRWQDAVLGIGCAIILLFLRYVGRSNWFKISKDPAPGLQTAVNNLPNGAKMFVSKFVWFICTSRNAIIVVICAIIAGFSDPNCIDSMKINKKENNCTWTLTGSIKEGLPPIAPPPFYTIDENNSTVTFQEMTKTLGGAIIVIPVIAILESVAIAKAFANGKPVDASQEMIALGFCNIFGSFVSSMPTTGSFSRTAVNAASGVGSTLGGVFTGMLVILCLAVLIPFCAFIPKATLAAVIITAVIFSVEHHIILPMWRSKKLDLLPMFTCFFVCVLYELEMGILAGVALQLVFVLYHAARPNILVEMKQVPGYAQEYLHISPDQGILFPSVSHVRNVISKAGSRQAGPNIPIVINCSKMNRIDFTAAEGFTAMLTDFKDRSIDVYWQEPSIGVAHTLRSIAKSHFRVIYGDIQVVQEGEFSTLGYHQTVQIVDELNHNAVDNRPVQIVDELNHNGVDNRPVEEQ